MANEDMTKDLTKDLTNDEKSKEKSRAEKIKEYAKNAVKNMQKNRSSKIQSETGKQDTNKTNRDVQDMPNNKTQDNEDNNDRIVAIKQSELEKYENSVCELKNTAQRVMAEFENFRKRSDREKEEFCRYSDAQLIKKLLPVIDSFENALKTGCKEENSGINLIYKQLMGILEKEGLREISCSGCFDSNYHDVLLTEESDKKEGEILEVLQKGYMYNDRVLRHAKLKISKGCKEKNKDNAFLDSEKQSKDQAKSAKNSQKEVQNNG